MTEMYLPYPDAELVGLAVMATIPDPPTGLQIDTFLRSGWTPPIILVNRIGGAPDNSDVTDFAILRFAFYGPNRMAAWDLAAKGEGALMAHRCRNVYVEEYDADILIDSVDIVVGGQQLADTDPDDRRVVKDFAVGLRRAYYLLST